jgi:hypothetical protein
MESQSITVEEIRSTLDQLRQNPLTKRRFPQKLWDSIIQLTKTYPLNDICRQLDINPVYLRRKIQNTKKAPLEFREVSFTALPSTNTVTIELSSTTGLKAIVQGSISCLDCLYKLFGE